MKNLVKITTTIVLWIAMVVAFSGAVNAGAKAYLQTQMKQQIITVGNNTVEIIRSNNTTTNNAPIIANKQMLQNNTPVNNVVNNTP